MKKIIVLLAVLISGCSSIQIKENDTCAGVTSYSVDLKGNPQDYKCHTIWGEV